MASKQEAPYATDAVEYPGALMLEAIHFDGTNRDNYLKARGVKIAVPLFLWATELAQGQDCPTMFYYQNGSAINEAITRIKADPSQPADAAQRASMALYDMEFENSEWAKYVVNPET